MPNGAEAPLPTPILDLTLPLPQRRSRLRSQAIGFVFGLIATLVFLAALRGDSEYFGVKPVILFIAIFAAIFAHEAGHLLAGWMVGFHFNSIQVAWLSLGYEYGKLTVHVRRERSATGYASIQIDRIYRLRRRLMFFVAGGPAASILSVVVAVVIVNVFDLHKSWAATPAACLAFVSLLFALMSLFPMARKGRWSDGARLEMLITSRDKTRRWFCLAALSNEYRRGRSPKLWNTTWAKAAASVRDNSADEMSACWLAYLMLEAAVFQAWERGDVDKSAKWLSRVKAPGRLPRLMQIRGTIAMNCAKRDFESAHTKWREGQSLIEKLPATPLRESLISWAEWQAEIRERESAKAH